jgi:hypothetical protein
MLRKTLLGLGAAIALGSATTANALPLLAENSGIKVNEILTLFPDSNDPNVFYFMPDSSGVVFDETTKLPQIGFTYWGLLKDGKPVGSEELKDAGAWLTFTMRLKSGPAQRAALQSLIDEGKRIAVLPVQESIVGLTSTKSGETPAARLFEEFHFSQKAGLAETEVGVNAVMTGIGAKVFKSAIDNPQLMKTDYCYKVKGLGPNMKGTIYVKWDKVYDHFEAQFSAGGFFRRVDIAVEVEKLKQQNLVTLTLDGGDATEMEKLYELTNTIIARLFVPELKMEPVGHKTGGWSFSRFSMKFTHKEELKEETWKIEKRDIIDREFCSSMGLKDLTGFKKHIVKDADAADGQN